MRFEKLYLLFSESLKDDPDDFPKMGAGDVDADFEVGETNFPHGDGYPNSFKWKDYEDVVQIDSIDVTEEDIKKFDKKHLTTIKDYVVKHIPWIYEYDRAPQLNSINNQELKSVLGEIQECIHTFNHWRTETRERVLKTDWWLEEWEKAQAITKKYPNVQKEIDNFYKLYEFIMEESPENAESDSNYPCYVTLYDITRRLGGGEEGGWWYDNATLVKSIKVKSFIEANRAAKSLYNELKDADLDGKPKIYLEKNKGNATKEEIPSYE